MTKWRSRNSRSYFAKIRISPRSLTPQRFARCGRGKRWPVGSLAGPVGKATRQRIRINTNRTARTAALFEAGCDDAVFGERDGLYFAEFDRSAVSFPEAVGSSRRQIETAVPDLRVMRIEPEELVNASAIAERTKRTRESIRLLIEHKRGPGNFPPPVVWVAAKQRLWRWSEVARWFAECLGERTHETVSGAFLSTCNAALEVRNYVPRLELAEGRAIVEKIVSETPGLFETEPHSATAARE